MMCARVLMQLLHTYMKTLKASNYAAETAVSASEYGITTISSFRKTDVKTEYSVFRLIFTLS